ncbi:ketoacyl-synt-domain-containing protein [Corynespora cassiicola Philippines]|uniref:Ketoacyl-synt-domain-containing protein n=1 Tax=Corynespora cassiicola Philippines TaxID=1448308 RepID=A0A2T2NM19_CORCC|nr:ketoacyl-synt-domain-containing protein [Corynespora cassiicola Philippines]
MTSPRFSQKPSVAVFCPQSKATSKEYLGELQRYMKQHEKLHRLGEEVKQLRTTWDIIAARREDIAALPQGPRYLKALHDWIDVGASEAVANAMSGILSLPLLLVIQTCQYFQYLQLAELTHEEFLAGLKVGGAQGYCGGLLPALAIACAKNEDEVITMASVAMRIALVLGSYGELGDDENIPGPTTIVVRLRREGQGDDLVRGFPGAYVSAITDPKTISIVGPVPTLEKLSASARQQGLLVQGMHLRGKVHNPENADLAKELCAVCDENESLSLPDWSQLQVPVYSNTTGRQLRDCSLTHQVVRTVLEWRCEWWTLLNELAQALKSTGAQDHTFAMFGIGDCVPLTPFHQASLKVSKIDVHRSIQEAEVKDYKPPADSIAVVGAACRLPGANNLEELWEILATGTSKAEEIRPERIPLYTSFRASQDTKFTGRRKFYGNFIDGVDGFDNAFFHTNPKEAAYMDPQQRILLELAYQAMDSSGYMRTHKREAGDNVGCFIGASFNEYLDNTCAHAPTAYTATGTIRAFLCGKISYYFGWSGPAEVIDTACSASLVAVHRACKAIAAGECSMALAGGVNIMSGVNNFMDLGKAGFLSPTGQCKPFDKNGDGYCRADGAGLVVLKSLQHARADGDNILGIIPGVATNQGGLSASLTVPSSLAQMALYRRILKQAGMKPEHISYVECHGTGTQAGDPLEIASVRDVFSGGNRLETLHIGSLKGNIGHSETAAGVASLLKVLAMLQKQRIPPLASFKTLNPKIPALTPDKIAIAKRLEEWDAPLRAACVNSYGAAGSNSALLCVEDTTRNMQDREFAARASALPFVISAASKESLTRYCNILDDYLSKHADLELGDVAYTLAERRQRHRFQLTTTAHDLASLQESLHKAESNIIDVAKKEIRPVVLAFGGQSKQTVGLSRSLYESSPRLRAYIQECDNLLIELGYPSPLSAIFSQEPQEDVVTLQTGTFAVQYACAKCWMDAGVPVSAVIGHSFGELTALTVSGALSLRSGLRIVAARANLMSTKWGSDRGTMLAVHAERRIVQVLINLVGENELEVACYNAITSQVLVGTASAIERAEALLTSESQFAGVRSQRVDVTHGFHSKFTEPLLDDLSAVASTISFGEAKIPLEMCVPDGSEHQQPDAARIAQHTRQPVYFSDAVRRIEKRLGPNTLWLEAGIDSPIIPMIKRAVSQPAEQVFLGLRFAGAKNQATVLPDVTLSLWRENMQVSFWSSLGGPTESGFNHVWLPPYEFVHTSMWVKNIDHATEAQVQAKTNSNAALSTAAITPEHSQRQLVTQKEQGSMEFSIDVSTKRFREIVSGHAVRARPLSPASMYMECAFMGLQQYLGSRLDNKKALYFDNLSFEQPLGVNLNQDVTVSLHDNGVTGSWDFQLSSKSKANSKQRASVHGRGKLRLGEQPTMRSFQHLITERMEELTNKPGTETLMSKRAYGLFSQVVTYAPLLQGMQMVTMDGTRAVASIKVPAPYVGTEESTAILRCDTVSIDTFIQVVGLLINSSDACIPNHAFVATGIDSVAISNACDFLAAKLWTVYASYRLVNETTAVGDVYVLTLEGTVAITILGVKFTRVPINTLEKLLDSANSSTPTTTTPAKTAATKAPAPKAPAQPPAPSLHAVPELVSDDEGTDIETPPSSTPYSERDDNNIRKMIAMYTGASEDAITLDSSMADLGVDSLAAVEFAEDLRSQYGKEIESTDLLTSTLMTLTQLCLVPEPKPLSHVNKPKSFASESLLSVPTVQSRVVEKPAGNVNRQNLLKIVSEASGAPVADITDTHTLRDLGVDSLAAVELKSELEDAFSKEIDENDVHLDSTVAEIVAYLSIGNENLAGQVSAATPTPIAVIPQVSQNIPTSTADAPRKSKNVRHRVISIISEACGAETDAMRDEDTLRDLGVDSLAAVELKSELEDAFDIELDDNLLDLTVKEAVNNCGGAPMGATDTNAAFTSTSTTSMAPTMPTETRTSIAADLHSTNGNSKAHNSMRNDSGALRHPSPWSKFETVVYKEVDGVSVQADVFFPQNPPVEPMPVALMIHGGGHMTLSRKAVRPAQTDFLLANGILPVSIDYRLCPEVNIIEGPIADTLDAYKWVQVELPTLAKAKGIVVDPKRVVVIGWSTGGHLAMTTAWTSNEANIRHPKAILSFYGPTDFESGDLDVRRAEEYPERTMKMTDIIKALPKVPITGYERDTADTTGLGWVRPGDPRSELVLSLFKEGNGLPLLLNGLPKSSDDAKSSWLQTPSPDRVAAISPMSQLRRGRYNVPTYIIHGTNDEIVPYHTAVKFIDAMRTEGIEGDLLTVKGARHIHDVALKPGSKRWEETVAPGYQFLFRHL